MDLGRRLVREAGELALRHQAKGIGYEAKTDDSPVTIADRECEQLIARAIEEAFPEDGLLGEESSAKQSRNGRRWIIDPIDGTRDFVRGNPVWANLLALEEGGEVVAGFVNFPARNELYLAARGQGAFMNDSPIHISSITTIAHSVLCLSGLNSAMGYPFARDLLEWIEPFWAVRGFGGCVDAMTVCSGRAEIWIEMSARPWDFAPLKIVAEEAGAKFFDFEGKATIYGGNAVISVPALETEILRFVSRRAD